MSAQKMWFETMHESSQKKAAFAVLAILSFLYGCADNPMTPRNGEADPAIVTDEIFNYTYQVVNTYPHDATAFTQGLAFDDGFFLEGTGLHGRKKNLDVKKNQVYLIEKSTGIYQKETFKVVVFNRRGFEPEPSDLFLFQSSGTMANKLTVGFDSAFLDMNRLPQNFLETEVTGEKIDRGMRDVAGPINEGALFLIKAKSGGYARIKVESIDLYEKFITFSWDYSSEGDVSESFR